MATASSVISLLPSYPARSTLDTAVRRILLNASEILSLLCSKPSRAPHFITKEAKSSPVACQAFDPPPLGPHPAPSPPSTSATGFLSALKRQVVPPQGLCPCSSLALVPGRPFPRHAHSSLPPLLHVFVPKPLLSPLMAFLPWPTPLPSTQHIRDYWGLVLPLLEHKCLEGSF